MSRPNIQPNVGDLVIGVTPARFALGEEYRGTDTLLVTSDYVSTTLILYRGDACTAIELHDADWLRVFAIVGASIRARKAEAEPGW